MNTETLIYMSVSIVLIIIMIFLVVKIRKLMAKKTDVVEIGGEIALPKLESVARPALPLPAIRVEKKIVQEKSMAEQAELFEKAKPVVRDARKSGFSDLEIRNMFRERGWRDDDIDKLIGEIGRR